MSGRSSARSALLLPRVPAMAWQHWTMRSTCLAAKTKRSARVTCSNWTSVRSRCLPVWRGTSDTCHRQDGVEEVDGQWSHSHGALIRHTHGAYSIDLTLLGSTDPRVVAGSGPQAGGHRWHQPRQHALERGARVRPAHRRAGCVVPARSLGHLPTARLPHGLALELRSQHAQSRRVRWLEQLQRRHDELVGLFQRRQFPHSQVRSAGSDLRD